MIAHDQAIIFTVLFCLRSSIVFSTPRDCQMLLLVYLSVFVNFSFVLILVVVLLHPKVLSAATIVAKHTSALCNACRLASSKTSNPVAKRQFVQSAKEVANSTANLVKSIKVSAKRGDLGRGDCHYCIALWWDGNGSCGETCEEMLIMVMRWC